MLVWPWILGGGAAAAAAATYLLTQKKTAAQLPPYTPPAPLPSPPKVPSYVAPLPVPPPPPPRPVPSEVVPIVVPPPPPPAPSYDFKPVSPTSNLQTVPTVYQAQQGQPGPSGTPYSYTTMEVTTARDPLNLRSSPNGSVIGTMPKGSKFLVDKIEGGWAHGKSASSGQIGWASMLYLGGSGATTESFSSKPYGTETFSAGNVATPTRGGLFLEGFASTMRQTMVKRRRLPAPQAAPKVSGVQFLRGW